MTQLVLPHSIEAGTEIVAAEHQDNYVAIRDIINGNLDIDNLADTLKALVNRTVWGNIGSDGSISSGSGDFTVSGASGVYTVSFTTPFSSAPAVTITPIGIQRFFAITTGPAGNGFTVTFANTIAGAAVASAFSFEAVGARS